MVFTFERLFAFLRRFRHEPTPYERALRALGEGRHADALAQLEQLLATLPSNDKRRLTVENKRGVALVYLGRKDEAQSQFEAILASDAVYVPAIVNLGNMALESGNFEEAVKRYEAAVNIDDFYPGAHYNLGVAYKRLGRTGDAVRELRRATNLEGRAPRNQSTY